MFKSKLQFWTFELLMIAVLIFVSTKISFLFQPIGIFITTLFFPILIAGFLFFLFNPIVRFLAKWKVPKGLGILLIYVVFLGLISLLIGTVGPSLSRQVTDLVKIYRPILEKLGYFLRVCRKQYGLSGRCSKSMFLLIKL